MSNAKTLWTRIVCLCVIAWQAVTPALAYTGKVVDAATLRPIAGAWVTTNQTSVQTDASGQFSISAIARQIGVRAPGYLRRQLDGGALASRKPISLVAFRPKALYLSVFGIGSTLLRDPALKLIDDTELNALVIDVKGDRGLVAYHSKRPLAGEIGAEKPINIKDPTAFIADLHKRGIYIIARVVVFKDTLLATARPEWAVKTRSGAVWRDREGLAWIDPSRREAWDYTLGLAEEAAQYGVDEIQFDYLRFPDDNNVVFAQPNTQQNRVKAIGDFLSEARKRLISYNVFIAADIFGYVCWNLDDTHIGQDLKVLSGQVDYVSPMLYPSGFQFGIPGYLNPVADPYEIVYRSLRQTLQRTGLPGARFRPWLQAFRDYAFDRRLFAGPQILAQITAAETAGVNGWMLWNPRNIYSRNGLQPKQLLLPLQKTDSSR